MGLGLGLFMGGMLLKSWVGEPNKKFIWHTLFSDILSNSQQEPSSKVFSSLYVVQKGNDVVVCQPLESELKCVKCVVT